MPDTPGDAALAALRALLADAMAPAMSRTTAEIVASLAELRDEVRLLRQEMTTLGEGPIGSAPPPVDPEPPVADPEPPVVVTPTPRASGLIEITSASGTVWPVELPEAEDDRLTVEVPAEIAGSTSLRLVVDHGRRAGVRWADVWLRNDISMREGGGPASYAVRVVLDGAEVLRRDVPRHHQYRAWGRLVSTGPLPETPWPDAATLRAAGVANYAGSVDESVLQRYAAAMADPSWESDVFATRGLYLDMPATGGRPDIGPATEAAAAALISRDRRARDYLIGQAEAAGGIPWHHWDAARGTWMRVTDWPGLWTDPRGGEPGSGTLLQPVPSAAEVGWELDSAHQPDCSYVAWLLTGREAFRDNLKAQGAWNVLFQWPGRRGDSDMLVVWDNQVRGSSWALRQIDEAAWASPEGSPEKAYFTAASEANWRWVVDNIPIWTEAQGEAHGWLPGEYGTAGGLSLWQQDYFASTAIAAAKRGNPHAKTFLEWAANFHLNRVAKLGHDGVGYILAISDPKTGETYRDWSRIKRETEKRGWSNGSGWEQSNGNYGAWFRSTLAGYADLLKDAEARKLFKALPAMGAPWTQPQDFRRDPLLSIAPAE